MTKFDPDKIDHDAAEREMQDALESADPFASLAPVEAKVARNRTDLVTFRLRSDEFQEIERAASGEGMTLSEFMRRAALTRARHSEGLPPLTPSLVDTLDQLTRQYRELRREPRAPGRRSKASST